MQVTGSRRIRQVVLVFLVCFALFVIFFAIDTRSEAERVEAETVAAVRKIQILNSGRIRQSPVFAAELILRSAFGKKDARNHYIEQFDLGMNRLVELGVLEKRAFVFGDTNSYSLFVSNCVNGITPSTAVLWRVSSKTGGVDVVANPAEMAKWEAAIKARGAKALPVGKRPNLPDRRFSPVVHP